MKPRTHLPTLRHLKRKAKPPHPKSPQSRDLLGEDRLCFYLGEDRASSYAEVGRRLADFQGPTLFYVDTNFLKWPSVPAFLWQALLSESVFLTAGVWHEIQPWLKEPFHNNAVREAILHAHAASCPRVFLDNLVMQGNALSKAAFHYIHLLLVRKRYGRVIFKELQTKLAREPSTAEFHAEIHRFAKPRHFDIMRKGFESIDRPNFFTDEELVVLAVFAGIRTGKRVVILSRDKDVYEQFYNLLRMIDRDYLSMLSADAFFRSPSSFHSFPMVMDGEVTRECFVGFNNVMVVKEQDILDKIIPQAALQIPLFCIWLGGEEPNLAFAFVNYRAEKDMERLFKTKGETNGLNTHLFNGRNCRYTGLPIDLGRLGDVFVIAHDRYLLWDGTMRSVVDFESKLIEGLPWLDVMAALEERERSPSILGVDP